MKKLISLILAAVMLTVMAPCVFAEEVTKSGACGENLTWTIEGGVLTISGAGEMDEWTWEGVPWHSERENISLVVIESGVTSIGDWAFFNCLNLKSVTIPEGVTKIGEYAFYGCHSIESAVMPNSVTSIGNGAFTACENLASITMPKSLTEIGFSAFKDCVSLENITLPKSVTSISWDAFVGTAYYNDETNWENGALYIGDALIKVKRYNRGKFAIKDGTRCVADRAFYECYMLTDVHIPESVTEIGVNAFGKCNIVSITLPEGVTKISANAFYDCRGLKSIKFPKNVTEIDESAFAKCVSLKSMTIPESVTKIGFGAFSECDNLSNITLPEGLTEIGNGAFWGCKSLTEIKIPEGVTQIGQSAFYGCEKLANITLPEGVTNIGRQAFEKTAYYNDEKNWENGALYIESTLIKAEESRSGDFAIKDGTKFIANAAFEKCRDITNVTIPESMEKIGVNVFGRCDRLMSINVREGNTKYTSVDGVLFDKNKTVLIQYPIGRIEEEYRVPEGVRSIGNHAFYYSKNLTTIFMAEGLAEIGESAFWGCSRLHDVYYGGSEGQWSKINIGDDNEMLETAKVHFN